MIIHLYSPDLRTRPSRVAQEFMRRKGYNLRPIHYIKVEGQDVWYYYYDLPEGLLELEVEVGPWDIEGNAKVTAFVHGEHTELLVKSN